MSSWGSSHPRDWTQVSYNVSGFFTTGATRERSSITIPKTNQLNKQTNKLGLFITGDWKTNVGSQEIPGITGKFGLGIQNEAWQSLRVLWREHTGHGKTPLFQQYKRWLYIWTSPDGQHWSQIDYILWSWIWRSCIQSAKTRPGPDCGYNHELLIAKFRLNLKKGGEIISSFRYDLDQISDDYTVEVTKRSRD